VNISPNGFHSVVQNNLIGTWNMTHCCATKAFIPQRDGVILNVVAQVKRGFPGMSHTGAARAGVINLTKSLAVEWSPYQITVNCIAPGVIDPNTSGTKKYESKLMENAKNATPLKRLGTVEEISTLMVYMVLPISKFITGQCYYIDGGQSLYGDFFNISKL
jgi:citronellol/citronellal dehydrogenase